MLEITDLRDMFAANALHGILAASGHDRPDPTVIARRAYLYADAMLKFRDPAPVAAPELVPAT